MKAKTGIKILHSPPDGKLWSILRSPWFRSREVQYVRGQMAFPNKNCGPLSLYRDTPEGLQAAMGDAAWWSPGCCAVFRCLYEPSGELAQYYVFEGREKLFAAYKQEESRSFELPPPYAIGEIVRLSDFSPHTVLADSISLREELQVHATFTLQTYVRPSPRSRDTF